MSDENKVDELYDLAYSSLQRLIDEITRIGEYTGTENDLEDFLTICYEVFEDKFGIASIG